MTATVPWVVASYLLGAIPTSLLAARYLAGVDLRTAGSGNLGATNLYRVLGFRYALPVGLLDMAKGAIPVLGFARWAELTDAGALLLGTAAILGHVFSLFVRFRGGKGVATSAGVLLGFAPFAFAGAAVLWGATVWLTGYVSLGSIIAAGAFPGLVAITRPGDTLVFWFSLVVGLAVIGFHQSNIRRLVAGTENRFGRRGRA